MNRPLFVARERELTQLDQFLTKALAGQGQVAFVSGQAGTGKTALVTEFARRAQAEHMELVVAVGQGDAQTGIGDPYLPFREVLNQLTGSVDARPDRGAVGKENANRLGKLVTMSGQILVEVAPDLIGLFLPGAGLAMRAALVTADKVGWLEKVEKLAQRPKPGERLGSSGLEQDQVFEQYTRWLTTLAEKKPLLLILDDLQWADATSLALLFRLGRRIGRSRILLLGTYRPEEVALQLHGERHPLEKVAAELKRYGGEIEVDLDSADDSERWGFVEALLDTEPNCLDIRFREALFQHTGGHALFTVELLRALQEQGELVQDTGGHWTAGQSLDWGALPARVEGVIEERIGRLAEELRAALTVASVEGEEFTAEVVAQVQALDTRMLVRHLSEDLQKEHRLVTAQGLRRLAAQRLALYRFQHSLFQRYLYNSLDAVERACLHEDVGKVLEALYGAQAGEVAVQLARHFAEAGLADQAVPYYQLAAEAARQVYANEEAISNYRQALALLEVERKCDLSQRQSEAAAQLHEGLADVLEVTGQHKEARHAYGEALARIPEGQPLWQSRLYRAIGKSWEVQYCVDEATHAYSRAETVLGQAPTEPDPAWWQAWIEIQVDRIWLCYWQRHGDAMATLVEVARPALEQYGTPVQRARFFQVLVLMGWQRDRFVASDETMAHARASLAASQQTNNLSLVTMSQFQLGFSALWRDELDEAEEALQSSLSLAKRTGDVVLQARCLTYLTIVRRRCGQVDDVRQYVAHSLAAAETAQLPVYAACARASLAWVAWRQGDLLEAEENGRAALEIWLEAGDPMPFEWMARWPLLGTALAQGQIPEAMDQARALLEANQQRLPDALETVLKDLLKAEEQTRAEMVHALLDRAVDLAQEMGYL
jgi:adenylate cyclase